MPELSEGIFILPQRGRPSGFERLIKSVQKNDPEARVVVVLDEDDPDLEAALRLIPLGWTRYVMGDGKYTISTAQKINYAVSLYPNEKFYGLLANDIEVTSFGGLNLLAQGCPMFGLSYGHDSIHGKQMATHPCVSGELVRALGWWAYPKAKHTCIDLYIGNLAHDAGGANFLPEVHFYHHHHSQLRSEYDAVYRRGDDFKGVDREAADIWKLHDNRKFTNKVAEAMCRT